MKISFLTEGGSRIGLGHLSRCIALWQAFKEDNTKLLFIVNGDRKARDFLRTNGIDYLSLDWIRQKKRALKLIAGSEIVVVDSYLAPIAFYKDISKLTRIPVYLDDNKRLDYPRGIVINGSVSSKEISYPRKKDVIYLLGPKYSLLRKEFWNAPDKRIKRRIENVLVTSGGSSRFNLAERIVNFLKKKSKINFISVSSSRLLHAKEMFSLMKKADLCISGGGQTIYELARVGVPTIGICFAANQAKTLEGFNRRGFLKYAGRFSSRSLLHKIASSINSLNSFKIRKKMSVIGSSLIEGKGAREIRDILLQNYQDGKMSFGISLRPATKKDCYTLWLWRNHPSARNNSFNQEKINYKIHKGWFNQKIKDKRARIFIAENVKKNKIGQVRFEVRDNRIAYANACLNPRFFGRHFGWRLIKLGTEKFLKETRKVSRIMGEIKGGNIASKKAFERAGYIFLRRYKKGKDQVCVYEFRRAG